MTTDLERQLQELQAENQKLRQQLEQKSKVAARALASYQQRALHMEIIRQQNADLDQLAVSLSQAKQLAEDHARESEEAAGQYSLANTALEKEVAERKQAEITLAKRVRELRCLNEVGREIAETPSLVNLLTWVSERIPLAMQYPDLCKAAVEYEGQIYGAGEALTLPSQVVNALWVEGKVVGRIYIAYLEKYDFLDEESAMLGGIASRVSAYIENRRLVDQLQQRATELEEATTMLDSFFENTPSMIFIKDARELKFVRWNKANETLLGFNRQDVIGKSDYDFFPKSVADFFIAKDREVLAKGEMLDIPEEPIQTATGEVRFLHTQKVPILGPDGEPKYLMGVAEDITDRKKAEALLRENEQRYRQILDAITDMVLVKGPQSRIVWANKAFRDCYGMTNEQLRDLIDAPNVEPDYTQQYVKDDMHVFETGQVLNIPEEPITRYDGQILTVHTVKSPIFDVDGNVVMTVGVSRDVSERKQAEVALAKRAADLQESQQLLRTIIDATPDWIFVKDQDYRYRLVNQGYANSLHLTPGDFVGKNDLELGFPEEIVKGDPEKGIRGFWADDRAVMDSGQAKFIEVEPAVVDGQPIYLSTRKIPLRDSEDQVWGVLGFVQDITARQQAQEALAKRAAELQTVAQVSVAASTILDAHNLLQEVVDLTKSSFNLYHTHIYLLNEAGDMLQLAAGAGEIGQQMAAQGWSIALHHPHSLVAQAARTKQGVIVNNVRLSPDFLPNPLLPETRSEMAIPMMVRNQLVGVLDIQANSVNYFTEEDIRIQTILAAQVAVALQNAQQYGQTEAALAETAWLYQISAQLNAATTIKELFDAAVTPAIASGAIKANLVIFELDASGQPEWAEVVEAMEVEPTLPVGSRFYLPESLFSKLWLADFDRVLLIGNVGQDERLDPVVRDVLLEHQAMAGVVMALIVGQRRIGQLLLSWDTPQDFTENDQHLYESIATQTATILDNQLLLRQVQRRADRERLVNTITQRIQSTTTIEGAIQAAVRELGQAFQARSTQIELKTATEVARNQA